MTVNSPTAVSSHIGRRARKIKAQPKPFRVTYYYLATGMEGRADIIDHGTVMATDSKAACRIVAKQESKGNADLESWILGCLSAKEI